jgi:hypothetical protein
LKNAIMLSEQVFYLFLFPWFLFLAIIPGVVMTFLFAGIAGQLLNYLPGKNGD